MAKIELESKYDVVIVGSGPAGAATAKAISGRGLRTVIVEKSKLPRYKMCSGVLSPTSVKFVRDHFGQIPDQIISNPKETIGARVYTAIGGEVVDLPFSVVDKGPGLSETGMSIKRPEFDHWLCTCGDAEIVDECRFRNIERRNSGIVVVLEQDGQQKRCSTRYLVGADGPLSRVRNTISPDFDKGLRMIPNYEEWYKGEIDLEPKWLNVFIDSKVTSYFASVFHKDGKIIVVTGAKQPEPVKKYFEALIDHLKQDHGLVINEKLASHGCVLHDMSATGNFHLGEGNVLLVGEAGGFSRALGEGISSAFITGNAAGEAILGCMETGRPALELYTEKVAPEVTLVKSLNRIVEETIGLNPFTR